MRRDGHQHYFPLTHDSRSSQRLADKIKGFLLSHTIDEARQAFDPRFRGLREDKRTTIC